jgi:hypothetical protein
MLQLKPGDRIPVSLSSFRLFHGEVLRKWPHLTESNVRNTGGELVRLVTMLQDTYGYSRKRAEKELDLLIKEFSEKMRRAAA